MVNRRRHAARWFGALLVAILVAPAANAESAVVARSRPTLGWIERAAISRSEVIVHAKLDTGADLTALHAQHIEEFQRDGQTWVRFDVTGRDGRQLAIEHPVKRHALIKRPQGKGERRPVIRLPICLGNTLMLVDVSLVNRERYEHQMLLGRNFLAGNVVIDPAMSFVSEPSCRFPSEQTKP